MRVNLLHNTPIFVALKALGKPYKQGDPTKQLLRDVTLIKGHESVLEHISFNFEILDLPRYALMELTRHRIASYTVESTRYNLHKMIKAYIALREQNPVPVEEAFKIKEYRDFVNKHYTVSILEDDEITGEPIDDHYKICLRNLEDLTSEYNRLKTMVSKSKLKERLEDYLKPYLIEGKLCDLVFTINLRALRNFLNLRMAADAHPSIRRLAKLIYLELRDAGFESYVRDIYVKRLSYEQVS